MISILREPDVVFFDRTTETMGTSRPSWQYLSLTASGAEAIREDADEYGVYLSAPHGVCYMTLRWNGEFSRTCRVFGDAFERTYGDLEWRGLIAHRVMPWYCVIKDGDECVGYGVKVRPNAFCYWQIDEEGVSLTLDLRCGASPVYLTEPLCTARLVERKGNEKPYAFLRAFCGDMADNPVFASHPVYGTNSWYYLYSASTGELIRKDAAMASELAKGLDNRPYTVVDCGWSDSVGTKREDPCAGTAFGEGNENFGDMKTLANDIKRFGARPGIWLRPLCISNGSVVPDEMVLRKVSPGDYTCLDPSMQGSLEIVAADMRRAVFDWGFELVKIDFTTYDLLGKFHMAGDINAFNGDWVFSDTAKTSAMIIKELYATIAKNAGDAVIIGCNCVSHLSSGYFHLYRVGDDTSGQRFERTRIMGVNTLAYRLCQHKTFYDIDADCMGQTESISWALNAQWLDLLSRSGTPLFVSVHPDRITLEQKQALKEAFYRASLQRDILEPLDFENCAFPSRFLVNDEIRCYHWFGKEGVVDI